MRDYNLSQPVTTKLNELTATPDIEDMYVRRDKKTFKKILIEINQSVAGCAKLRVNMAVAI